MPTIKDVIGGAAFFLLILAWIYGMGFAQMVLDGAAHG